MKILIIGKNRKKNLKIQVTKIYFQIFFQFLLIIQQQMNQQILDNFVKKTISLNENVHFPGDFQEIFSAQNSRRLNWNSKRNPGDFLDLATLI